MKQYSRLPPISRIFVLFGYPVGVRIRRRALWSIGGTAYCGRAFQATCRCPAIVMFEYLAILADKITNFINPGTTVIPGGIRRGRNRRRVLVPVKDKACCQKHQASEGHLNAFLFLVRFCESIRIRGGMSMVRGLRHVFKRQATSVLFLKRATRSMCALSAGRMQEGEHRIRTMCEPGWSPPVWESEWGTRLLFGVFILSIFRRRNQIKN